MVSDERHRPESATPRHCPAPRMRSRPGGGEMRSQTWLSPENTTLTEYFSTTGSSLRRRSRRFRENGHSNRAGDESIRSSADEPRTACPADRTGPGLCNYCREQRTWFTLAEVVESFA